MFKWISSLGAPVIFEATKLACCTRFSGVKIPFRFWSIDGARLKLNAARNILTQTTTKDMLQYSSSSLSPNWVLTMVKLGQICHF